MYQILTKRLKTDGEALTTKLFGKDTAFSDFKHLHPHDGNKFCGHACLLGNHLRQSSYDGSDADSHLVV